MRVRTIQYIVATLLLLACGQVRAFSILGHRIVAMRVLNEVRRNPSDFPPFLHTIARDPTLTAYYLGGSEAPDLGALCRLQRPNIQYSTHYEHPGLWIRLLFDSAQTDIERAFAWGWVVHQGADLGIHPWMDSQNLNYCEHQWLHPLFEIAIDSTVGAGLAECEPYKKPELALNAVDLLRRVTSQVSRATAHSTPYDDYVAGIHRRCSKCGAESREWSGIESGRRAYFDLGIATGQFDVVKAFELSSGQQLVDKAVLRATVRKVGHTADSPTLKNIATALGDALESGRTASCSAIGADAAAELAAFYSVTGNDMSSRLWSAARAEWQELDRNFDTGIAVSDPALSMSPEVPVAVALVIDSSGSMRENDPNDLRKRAAELLVDRTDRANFTIVRFDHRVSALAEGATDRAVLRRAISSIGADGGTLICQATHYALEKLANAEGDKAMVLLTDGKSQDSCAASDFSSQGIRIFTVGLSADANGAMLQAIASATGGSYVHARSATGVQSAFDAVIADVVGEATVADISGSAKPGGTSVFRFTLDATIRALSVLLTWPGSTLNLTLVSPSGQELTARVDGRTGSTYEMVRVENPAAGMWTAAVKSIDVAPSGEPFRIRAGAVTPVRLVLEPVPSIGASMRATLQGFPPGKPRVGVRVERPDGRFDSADVTGDESSLLASYAQADLPGAYNFMWSVAAGDITRFATRAMFVGESSAQGGSVLSVDGQYVRWDRGALYGVRPGLQVQIVRNGQQIGTGRVIDVRRDDSDVELDTVSGLNDVIFGDSIQVELTSWTADAPP